MAFSAYNMSTSLGEMERIVSEFDSARLVPICADAAMLDDNSPENRWDGAETFFLPAGTGMAQIPHRRAVVNNRTNRVVEIVSNRYAIVQHDTAARLMLEGLRNNALAEKATFNVHNGGNRIRVRAKFDGVVVNDGSQGGLHLGVEFGNSYDQKNSFFGRMFAWRQICSNGAIISKVIPGASFNIRHVGHQAAGDVMRDQIERFVKNIVGAVARVSDLVEATRATEVAFKNATEVELTIADIVDRVNAPAAIVEQIPLQTNAYDVFNAVTYWASHDPGLSEGRRETVLQRAGARLLGVPEVRIPVPAVLGGQEVLREATEA